MRLAMDNLDILQEVADRAAMAAVEKALRLIPERINLIAPHLLSISEAAQCLRVSRRKMTEYISARDIPAIRDGGVVRIDMKDIERWIEKHKS